MKKYICYETNEIKTREEWIEWFNENGNHDFDGWEDFESWFADMMKDGLLEEVEVVRIIEKWSPYTYGSLPNESYKETVYIFRHGEDDFSIYYNVADYSIRGTWEDIKEDYEYMMNEKLEK